MVIGEPKNPRCFKNISMFPSKYTINAKAWMTSEIFLRFLREFEAKMGIAARKVLLFVDRCVAHPPDVSFLRNVKVIFLPPNCTSHLQPSDLGIIHALKVKCRTALALNLMDQSKPGSQQSSQLNLNILQAMNLIMYLWREVSAETIKNCFTKADSVKMRWQLL
ncbi:tigger transposable element-derived protein 6-like [Schistocerca serialis cubense]|uniref:tigger transposable element-derived protein 6-like n=1 Tax=Schistocerca serialis cubense TaxID=2023355 RepID=UPI00214E1EFB|nr:tigger transposable element-derived protein 6-like [Schistocerca serialis cubense]